MMSLWMAQASANSDAPHAGVPQDGWLIDPELVDPGYTQTMAGGTIQTQFPPPVPPPQPPEWLKSLLQTIGEFFQWAAPALKPMLWVGAILLLLFILYHFVPAFGEWVDDIRYRRRRRRVADEQVGHSEAGVARALLADADGLAAAGRFAEAIHLLLYRSVEDIEGRRPGLVQPAMTSRELAEANDLPPVARNAFSQIARAVEISLFGGRAIDEGAWQQCRGAYAELTVPQNWAHT